MPTAYRTTHPRWKRAADSKARSVGPRYNPDRELPVDKVLLAIVLGLTIFGAVMVYSASAIVAEKTFGSQFHFISRQGAWGILGLLAMGVAVGVDYRHYRRPAVVLSLLAISIVLLIVVLFLPKVNDTHRWITYHRYQFGQPSEIGKLGLAVFLAYFLEKREHELQSFKQTFLPATGIAALVISLVALEPDFGTALALGVVFFVMMFHAGVKLTHLATLAIPVVPAVTVMLLVPWRFLRIMAFLDPWKYQATYGFQAAQSMIAIGSGGTSGMGFAQGKQKLFFLPAPHTDFIFSVIGEELGLIGAATIVLLFAVLAWRGFRAARFAPDMFGQLLAVGLTIMISVQAFFNMSVALSLVPTKGIPLPFISSGGSSLAISLFAAGVLLNISKHGKVES